MAFCAFPVFLAFMLNRCSVRFFTTCRCILGFTPYSASLLFGLSLVAILVKHPELYPHWLRRLNQKIMFFYELFASLIYIEIGFCVWNSIETLLFFRIPSFLEEHCIVFGDYYIHIVESPLGVSLISNLLALTLFLITLHTTRVCNFSLLLQKNGLHKFFADAGLTSNICKHHKNARHIQSDSDCCFEGPVCEPPMIINRAIPHTCSRMQEALLSCSRGPKMLRSSIDDELSRIYYNSGRHIVRTVPWQLD